MNEYVAAVKFSSLYKNGVVESPLSTHTISGNIGGVMLEGNICCELCLFLSSTSHFILTFLLWFLYFRLLLSLFFDLKGCEWASEWERIYGDAAKTEKATQFNLEVSQKERKEEKCKVCFYLDVFPPLPLWFPQVR